MPAVHTLNDKPVLLVVYAGNFKSLNEAFDSIKVFVLPYYRNYKYDVISGIKIKLINYLFNCSLVGYLCIHRLMLSLTSFS
ncbi:hypothetical protein AU593_004344 [Salmonella enterica subsp. enterica serovar Derby]|uniref:Uncharacterized protein n=2 Tax=Salmonella enterica TaxID=28901 RepID=A0A750L5C1_SALER|nr:hypothetical protein C4I14_15745 [Salmonella enterica subsp. enterica serovar Derby]EAM8794522.1 hypothetical protein [Salmonella enterica]EBG6742315.1 hypothetical protein [Salmonella enterica subsp. enterica]EBN3544599.1 hypothetical protein [Salmonella enterica subsp. enterica serovar Newport]EBS6606762.1 hypothetical protein [Salmonella enterica subsp. enterica serovar Indiana]EBY8085722.1 hypothetical protein [Salmonella enterica subsp. enterica serovar Banana]ECB2150159.1 hypothetica